MKLVSQLAQLHCVLVLEFDDASRLSRSSRSTCGESAGMLGSIRRLASRIRFDSPSR